MVRNIAREIAIHLSYELSFTDKTIDALLDERLTAETFETLASEDVIYTQTPNTKQAEYIRRLVKGVDEHAAELDGYIEKYAKGWKTERISRVSRSVLRLAIFEMLYLEDVPAGVSINEAVELCKKFDEESARPFVNGILNSVKEEIGNA